MQAITFAGVLGAIAGSFLNVVTYRLPRHESLIMPASHCTRCGTPVKPYDNIPILSFLLLRGHCRACSAPISVRYPLVEALTAALCVGAVLAHSSAARDRPQCRADPDRRAGRADRHRVPHHPQPHHGAGRRAALVIGLALDPAGEPERLIAGAAAGGFLLVAALAYPGGMGMGDVKLAAVMGLFLGRAVAPAILIALIAGVLVGAVVIARKGAHEGRKTAVPFGPFLALGAIVAVYAGSPLVDLYMNHFVH